MSRKEQMFKNRQYFIEWFMPFCLVKGRLFKVAYCVYWEKRKEFKNKLSLNCVLWKGVYELYFTMKYCLKGGDTILRTRILFHNET